MEPPGLGLQGRCMPPSTVAGLTTHSPSLQGLVARTPGPSITVSYTPVFLYASALVPASRVIHALYQTNPHPTPPHPHTHSHPQPHLPIPPPPPTRPDAGTEAGHLYCLQAPSLQPYAHWQAHPHGSPVLEVAAAGDGVMSLSAHRCVGICVGKKTKQVCMHVCGRVFC